MSPITSAARRLSPLKALLLSAAAMAVMAIAVAAAALPVAGDRLVDSLDVAITQAVIDEQAGRALVLLRSTPSQDHAGSRYQLGIQDLSQRKFSPRLLHQSHEVVSLLKTPEGMIIGDVAGNLHRLADDWSSGRELFGTQTDGSVCSLTCSPDGQRLISRGTQYVYVWDLPARRLLQRLDRLSGADVPPATDGEYLYEEHGGDVVQRSLTTGEIMRTIVSHGKVLALAVDADGSHLASVGYDQRLCLIDLSSGTLLWEAQHPTGLDGALRFLTPTLALSPRGCIATASCAGDPRSWTIHLWHDGRQLGNLEAHTDFVFGAAFAGDQRLYSWSGDGDLRRSDLPPDCIP